LPARHHGDHAPNHARARGSKISGARASQLSRVTPAPVADADSQRLFARVDLRFKRFKRAKGPFSRFARFARFSRNPRQRKPARSLSRLLRLAFDAFSDLTPLRHASRLRGG